MSTQIVRPQNRREFLDKLVDPYDPKVGNPNNIFSEPTKLGQPEENRARQISVKGDTEKDFYIGIKDIDEAVMYYFNNVLKLSVIQNNTRVPIPILYGTPENWKSVQQDGYYRDQNEKLMAPLLMFKRKSVTQNRNLGNKLDGNLVHNIQLFETRYNKRNFYSNFSTLTNRSPEKKYIVSVTPDYVTVDYEVYVWTYFVEQMDKVVESLNFASRSYWGDPNRFQFYSSIDSFDDTVTYNLGENRTVRSSFNLTLNGYLIPDSINKKLANANVYYGVSQVVFGLETTSGVEEFNTSVSKTKSSGIKSPLINDSVNNVNIISNVNPALITYLDTNKSVTGTNQSPTTVVFPAGWLTAPTPLPPTDIDNFIFFVNGQYVEKTSIVSFTTDGYTSTLVINPNLLQYTLEESDTIIATGKFN
jgi:hypothetical protein